MVEESAIHSPVEQNFTCQRCGKCCSQSWRIDVSLEEAWRIQGSKSFRKLESAGYIPLDLSENQAHIEGGPNGSCLFLEENSCQIHSELGAHQKPATCQIYPFRMVGTPEGYYLSLSFSCPAVLQNRGQPVDEQLPQLSRYLELGFTPATRNGPSQVVVITKNREISWADYGKLEKMLIRSYAPAAPVESLLRFCSFLGAEQWRDFSCAPLSPQTPLAEEIMAQFHFVCCSAIGFLEHPSSADQRVNLAVALSEGQEASSRLTGGKLRTFSIYGPSNEVCLKLVHRYLRNQVLGKRLLCQGSFLTRLLELTVGIAVLLYYLRQRLLDSERSYAVDSDLEWGFELLERRLMDHGRDLYPLFARYEELLKETKCQTSG